MRLSTRTMTLALALRHAGPLRRVRGWNRLLRRLFPLEQQDFRFEVPFNGYRYSGLAGDHIDWHVFFYGAYERDILILLARVADKVPSCVFMDVGANCGHHSLWMAAHCAAVHAVEPYPPLWNRIEEKVLRNRIDNVILHRTALGEFAGELPFYVPKGANFGTGSMLPDDPSANAEEPIAVSVCRGDDLLVEASVRHVDIIKIDVQGFEAPTLRGLHKTLERARPVMVVEVQAANWDECTACFPGNYGFYYQHRNSRWLNRYELAHLDGRAWRRPCVDVIACPEERSNLLSNCWDRFSGIL